MYSGSLVDITRYPRKAVYLGEGKLILKKTPLHFCHIQSWKRLQESSLRKHSELDPLGLRQFVVVYNLVLATPATALVPNRNSFAVQSVTWKGGRAIWATASPPYSVAQAYFRTRITHIPKYILYYELALGEENHRQPTPAI